MTVFSAFGNAHGVTLTTRQLDVLRVKLNLVAAQLDKGRTAEVTLGLKTILFDLDALAPSGRVSAAEVAPITAYARRVITSIGG